MLSEEVVIALLDENSRQIGGPFGQTKACRKAAPKLLLEQAPNAHEA